jgi:hypothetical protein
MDEKTLAEVYPESYLNIDVLEHENLIHGQNLIQAEAFKNGE